MSDLEIKERILEHSALVFLERGFSKVTIDEIAADLGISKKTLYKFYPSKEELLRTSLHSMMRSAGWELERIASSGNPLTQKLTSSFLVLGKYASRVRGKTLIDFQRFVPTLWKEVEQYREEHIIRRIAKMITDARDEGVFRPEVDAQILMLMLVSSIRGIVNPEILTKQRFSAEDASRTIFKILLEGALTDEARKEFHIPENQLELI